MWLLVFTRSYQKGDRAENWKQIDLVESGGRSTPCEKWTFRISWHTVSVVSCHTEYVSGRGEMRYNWDRLYKRNIPAFCHTKTIALFGDNKKWVSLYLLYIQIRTNLSKLIKFNMKIFRQNCVLPVVKYINPLCN